MSRKKKTRAKQTHPRSRAAEEDRASVTITVVWMLSALVTTVAVAVVLVGELLLWRFPPETKASRPFEFVPSLFLLIALITGIMCLTLMPVVYRVRRDPPPRSIAIGAVVVCLLPLAIIAWQSFSR
jgi:hypothetical protein